MDPEPFPDLNITSSDWLENLHGRKNCPRCDKSRKYFCYTCYLPIPDIQNHIPRVKLPLKVDIIKHSQEVDGKSTAAHAAILAPDHVTVYTYPSIPAYTEPDKVLLVFPGKTSRTLSEIVNNFENAEVTSLCETFSASIKDDGNNLNSKLSNICGKHFFDSNQESNGNCERSGEKDELYEHCHRECKQFHQYFKENDEKKETHDCDSTEDVDSKVCNEVLHTDNMKISLQKLKGAPVYPSSSEDLQKALCSTDDVDCHIKCKDVVHESTDTSSVSGVEQIQIFEEHTYHSNKCQRDRNEKTEVAFSLPFHTVIFIDCTWNQTHKIASDERLSGLTHMEIKNRDTKFWRHQKRCPNNYLSTVEAIYFFFREFHDLFIPYKYAGQYDNLLFFFEFIYKKLRNLPGGRKPIAYKLRRQDEIP